ncbi:bola-like protein [Amylocystis lapponica]|nr:bola-like protein [Amylocystis lapponica]
MATLSSSAPDPRAQPAAGGPVETSIRAKLTSTLAPALLTISNDSWQHRHHAAMRTAGGGNGETHFSIEVVSDAFKGKSTMQRHRLIYATLSEELAQGLHALSLKTKTPEELQKAGEAS